MTPLLRLTICISTLLIIISNALPAFAITLTWPDYPDGRLYRIDVQQKTLEAETQPNVWTKLGAVELKNVVEDAFPPVTRVTCLNTDGGRFRYLLIDCTQQVYLFDTQKHTLERLDKTFFRGYNCYSAKFLRKDTIYSFGGYGFWHTNNILTYYSAATKEWESLNPLSNAPRAIHRGFNGYLPENDTFFSAMSLYQSDSESKGAFTMDDSVYTYSFKQKIWQCIGLLKPDFKKTIQIDYAQVGTWFQAGRYFMLKYYKSPTTFFILVDPIRNEARSWKDNYKILSNEVDNDETNTLHNYIWNNKFYFRRNVISAKGSMVRVVSLSLDDLWKNSQKISTFYEPIYKPNYWWLYGLLGALLLGSSAVFWFKKTDKSKTNFNNITPDSLDTVYPNSLNEQERHVFDAFIKASDTGGLNVEQLNDLLQIGDKSQDNQRKIRAEMIKNVNLKLKLQWGIEEAIERKATLLDRRMYTYTIKAAVKARSRASEINQGKDN